MRPLDAQIQAKLEEFVSTQKLSDVERSDLRLILRFLIEYPEYYAERRGQVVAQGSNGSQLLTKLNTVTSGFLRAVRNPLQVKPVATTPDKAVHVALEAIHGLGRNETERAVDYHRKAMAAENVIGALLENYLAIKLRRFGWVWCAGNRVRAIDFLKHEGQQWQLLQVKNRDNTENSSSAAIRAGTSIQHWFRIYSKTGETNWKSFPDSEAQEILSEEDFLDFIRMRLGSSAVA
jgi:hypothetical protein